MSVKRAITEKPAKSKVKCSPSEELLKAWGVDITEGTGQKPIDWAKPVRKKETHEPVEVVTTKARGEYPVLVYLGDTTYTVKCTLDGRFHHKGDICLENVPNKMKAYVVAYRRMDDSLGVQAFKDAEYDIIGAWLRNHGAVAEAITEVEIDVP